MKRLASWNVNGIRACLKKGFLDWLTTTSPDIACLQEIKAEKKFFPEELLHLNDYAVAINPAIRPGYSGTAIFYKKHLTPKNIHYGIDIPKFDDEGRTIIFEYEDRVLFNCYFPNGQNDNGRVPFKLEYSDAIKELALKYIEQEKHVIICGDYNTAHTEIDLTHPKSNQKVTGFLPIERKWIDDFIESGFVDCMRAHHPGVEKIYSWWSYRMNCREKNVGWRVDYFFTNEEFFHSQVKTCFNQTEQLGSDHCPVILDLI